MKSLHRIHTAALLPLALLAAELSGVFPTSAQTNREGENRNPPREAFRDRPAPSRPARGDGPERILNEEQRLQLRQLMAGSREHIRELEKREAEARRGMHEAMFAENFDEQLAKERAGALGAIVAERALTRARIFGKLIPSLTPDQLERMRRHEPLRSRLDDGYGERRPLRLETRGGDLRRRPEFAPREPFAPRRESAPEYRRNARRPEPEPGRHPDDRRGRDDPPPEFRRPEGKRQEYRPGEPKRDRPEYRESDRDGRDPRGDEPLRRRNSPARSGGEPGSEGRQPPPAPAAPEQP